MTKSKMKKIVIHSAGGYERLKVEEGECNSPNADEVMIQVSYAGVNYADSLVRLGVYSSAKHYIGWPITPGFEVSGIIIAVGEAVSRFKIGDQVMAFTRFNGYSSVLNVREEQVIALPSHFNLSEGAAFPAVYMTAYYSLFQIFNLPKAGAKILVHSAGGGVGTALVQLAKIKGIFVVGIVGNGSKIEFVKNNGADLVFNKSDSDFSWDLISKAVPGGFDAVYDANGYTTLKESYQLTRSTGKLVVYGSHSLIPKSGGRLNLLKAAWGIFKTPKFDAMKMITENKSLICFNVSFLFEEKEMVSETIKGLTEIINENKLKPAKVNEFLFSDVAKAHQYIESGLSVGKIVLKM